MASKIDYFTPNHQETPIAVQSQVADGASHNGPGLFWLGGFKSSMDGSKATALASWASNKGLGCTRFDYSGHGASGGEFVSGTISTWLAESIAVFERYAHGPQIIIGSSMGGWLAMLLYRHLQAQSQSQLAHGLVLIAPAADMSEELMWKRFSPEVRRAIEEAGLTMGRDISVITHDDELSYLQNGQDVPIFTATRSSVRQAGTLLAEMIIQKINTPENTIAEHMLEAELVVGRSTGPAPNRT